MRIILASGDTNFRLALELWLSEAPGVEIVGTASDSKGMLSLITSNIPDLVLLDWDLPGKPAGSVLPELKRRAADTRLIFFGASTSARERAIQNGADEFLVKGDPPEKLGEAIMQFMQIQETDPLSIVKGEINE